MKTSQARYFSMRLNPIHAEHARAIAILDSAKQEGLSMAALIVDRLLRYEGDRVEMYPQSPQPNGAEFFIEQVQIALDRQQAEFEQRMESLLADFAKEYNADLKRRKSRFDEDQEDESADNDAVIRNFAASFMRRQNT